MSRGGILAILWIWRILDLKCEHSGTSATFLDMEIHIEEGQFVYHLFEINLDDENTTARGKTTAAWYPYEQTRWKIYCLLNDSSTVDLCAISRHKSANAHYVLKTSEHLW